MKKTNNADIFIMIKPLNKTPLLIVATIAGALLLTSCSSIVEQDLNKDDYVSEQIPSKEQFKEDGTFKLSEEEYLEELRINNEKHLEELGGGAIYSVNAFKDTWIKQSQGIPFPTFNKEARFEGQDLGTNSNVWIEGITREALNESMATITASGIVGEQIDIDVSKGGANGEDISENGAFKAYMWQNDDIIVYYEVRSTPGDLEGDPESVLIAIIDGDISPHSD